jgi:methionine-rich copper-binding protein CopC
MIAAIITYGSTQAETLTWDFTQDTPAGSVPNLSLPVVAQYNNNGTTALLSAASVSTGYPGATGGNNAGAASRIGGLNTAAGGSAAFEFTLQPSGGFQVNLAGLAFGSRSTGTGPRAYALRSSLDDYSSDIAAGSFSATGSWSLVTHDALSISSSAPMTFRLFGFDGTGNAGASTANWRIDDLSITVTTTPSSADTTPPTLASLTPADGAIQVPISAPLQIRFSETVQVGSGTVQLFKSDGTLVQSIPVPSASVTIVGATATIAHTELSYLTDYYVNISPGAFTDLASNSYGGIASHTTWNFTTLAADTTRPTATAFSPANGASNIAPPTHLTLTFSEPVEPYFGSDLHYVTVRDQLGAVVAKVDTGLFAVQVEVANQVATIPLLTTLDYGKSYYVEVDPATFVDHAGNPFAGLTGNTHWAFSTLDVPSLTATPYSQSFANYESAATLPAGWSFSGGPSLVTEYRGDWGSVTADPVTPAATLGGFKGNAHVFGYHHTSTTGTSGTNAPPLTQTLTLRNATGAPITHLTVTYKGRSNVPANTRIPVYSVNVAGTNTAALAYSTADGDQAQRNASVSGLNIAIGETFQIKWNSHYPTGFGSARQIGLSEVQVSATSQVFAPTVAGLDIPVASIGGSVATVNATVIADGGQTLAARGFVVAATAVNASPQIGGAGVTTLPVAGPELGAYQTELSGLLGAVSYSVSAYATNASGTSYSQVSTFTTLAGAPVLVTSYHQDFAGITGTSSGITNLPAGWTALSDASPPLQTFAGTWGTNSSTGGFLGNDSDPGVLGYRHTGSSGNLTVTLRLVNGTGAPLTSFQISYLGRMKYNPAAINPADGRHPIWQVAVNGSAPIAELAYDTDLLTDATRATTVTVPPIAAGAEFTITWTSNRGEGPGASKQIGISQVAIETDAPPGGTYAQWAATHVNQQQAHLDFDGDGVANGVEYFMGTAGNAFTPNPGVVAGKIHWPRAAGTTISTFKVEVSSNLTVWQDASVAYPGNLVVSAEQLQFTLPTTPAKLFVRLTVIP